MKKYLLIGKSAQMRCSFRRDPETGKFVQFKIGRGVRVELTEDEMTFHVRRQAGFGILQITEIEEPDPEPEVVSEPEPVVEPVFEAIPWEDVELAEAPEEDEEEAEPTLKKGRSRRKKIVTDDE